MKKIIKPILIGLGLILIPLLGVVAYAAWSMQNALQHMITQETGAVNTEIMALKDGHYNVYLVKGQTGFIAIDAGADPHPLEQEMKTVGINPDLVHTLLLTHADMDHVGGRSLFKNAEVFLPEAEESVMTGLIPRKYFIRMRIDIPHKALGDGAIVSIDGLKIECITLPGHTAGSSVYIINDRYLFSGDNFSINKDGTLSLFPDIFNHDSALQRESLKKIAGRTGLELILSPHYGITKNTEGLKAFQN